MRIVLGLGGYWWLLGPEGEKIGVIHENELEWLGVRAITL